MPPISRHAAPRNPVSFTRSDLLRILGCELRHAYGTESREALPRGLSELVERLEGREPGRSAAAARSGPASSKGPSGATDMRSAA